jgi:hypothetical protein
MLSLVLSCSQSPAHLSWPLPVVSFWRHSVTFQEACGEIRTTLSPMTNRHVSNFDGYVNADVEDVLTSYEEHFRLLADCL